MKNEQFFTHKSYGICMYKVISTTIDTCLCTCLRILYARSEYMQKKMRSQNWSPQHTHTHRYSYIYVCVCVKMPVVYVSIYINKFYPTAGLYGKICFLRAYMHTRKKYAENDWNKQSTHVLDCNMQKMNERTCLCIRVSLSVRLYDCKH